MGGKSTKKSSTKNAKPYLMLSSRSWRTFLWWLTVILAYLTLWISHSFYLHNLFENVRFFSHLADFEREMAYRTEMGLYFSYYKTLVSAPTFTEGLYELTNDNVTEFGHTINTLHRFNLYPEVILAGAFRIFKRISTFFDWKTETCWRVNRGEGLKPVESCEGFGNLHYFYIYAVFGIAGSVLSSVFLLGIFLSDSFWGGILSTAAFMFNHGEATRVQWTPPLRESFAYPIFISQIALLTFVLKNNSQAIWVFVFFTFLTIMFILFWQFSQFVLATQLGSLFVAFLFDFVRPELLFTFWKSYMASFLISLILLFVNPMLLNSLFSNSLIAIIVIITVEKAFCNYLNFRPLFIISLSFIYLLFVFGGKAIISQLLDIRDDNHVADILRSKFSNFATFHTRLYTCAAEFDFIGNEAILQLTKTLLLPSVLISFIIFCLYLSRHKFFTANFWWRNIKSSNAVNNKLNSSIKDSLFSEVFYNFIQLICFAVMSTLIMRLKLFSTPHFCIIIALIANKLLLNLALCSKTAKFRLVFVFGLIACMAYEGRKHIFKQLSMSGEYNNPQQEQLFKWIIKKTDSKSVFAGTMPIMANVKLSTLRPIVNHPQYENEEVRNRTLKVYSMYSRKSIDEVYNVLFGLGVNYYIFQESSCISQHPNPKCTYLSMWDLEDPLNRQRSPLCNVIVNALQEDDKALQQIENYFTIVHRIGDYIILNLKSNGNLTKKKVQHN